MTRPPAPAPLTLIGFAVVLALSACNPVAYVPSLIPTAPPTAGVRAGVGGNLMGLHGTAALSVAPADGVGFYARGFYGNALDGDEQGGPLTQRGGDLGVALAQPLSGRLSLDLGASVGREVVVDSDASYNSLSGAAAYRRVETSVRRVGAHAALLVGDDPPGEGAFRIGPAVRLTNVGAVSDGRRGAGVFVEPAVLATFASGPVEVTAQGGLSLLAAGDLFDDYTSVPFFGGVTAAVRF